MGQKLTRYPNLSHSGFRTQPIFTPEITNCSCGSKAHIIDEDFNMKYKVICPKCIHKQPSYLSVHRAICKWNNEMKRIKINSREGFWICSDGRIVKVIRGIEKGTKNTLCIDLTDDRTMGYNFDYLRKQITREELSKYKIILPDLLKTSTITRFMTNRIKNIYVRDGEFI